MNQTAVTDCLSQAIVDVAEREFNRLREEMSGFRMAQSVEGALQSLKGLASGKMPDYDEWDAPFYLTWYHPNHVNLAYSMIAATLKNTGRELPKNLYLLDFGCGTLATQFGLALAVADLLDEQAVKSIRVRPIDDSEPMVRLGTEVWDVFGELVREEPELGRLSAVIDSMRIEFGNSLPEPGEECWLSAMHVVYEKNCVAVKKWLALHKNRIRPQVGFITSHDNYYGRLLTQSVSPFENDRDYSRHQNLISGVKPLFRGGLYPITQWRRNLEREILNSPFGEDAKTFPLIIKRRYLKGSVLWQWRDAVCRVYTRIG